MGIIKIDEFEKHLVIHLEGDFVSNEDINTLRSTFKTLSEKENNFAIVDLEKTNFLSSASLGVLLSSNAMFERNNGKIVLASPNDYIRNLFKITKLDLIFDIFPNFKEAEIKLDEYRKEKENKKR
ncbi:MAG: STAS domain-containing protein [Ignavibacteria bacterium]|nr:STAS domain-containing protein [Ignavibacteria bacterium]